MLLAAIAIAAIAGPIGVGVLHPRVVKADEAQNFANLKFGSASLTPAQDPNGNRFFMLNDDAFVYKNVTMKSLIATAYGVRPDRIVGGPDWMSSQRFDFEAHWTPSAETSTKMTAHGAVHDETRMTFAATSPGGPRIEPDDVARIPSPATVQAMLRNFLSERASLRVRDDSAVLPVYELVVGNGGSKLTPTQDQQSAGLAPAIPAMPADARRPAGAHLEMQTRADMRVDDGVKSFSITNAAPDILCENLSRQLGREVVDKTGLTGRYNFEISLSSPADPDKLAATLRDQYGLDLQSAQQPVKVIDVDSVEMPQGN
jgi:uncharacterized protein (TIGR03435 family)